MAKKIEVTKRAPEFLDGSPVNLEAAALDALEWMRFWRQYLNRNHLDERWNESRRRMSRAIEALETYLPEADPVYHIEDMRDLYEDEEE
jgi:hypothetical protein